MPNYTIGDTECLKNLLGITDLAALQEAEARLVAARQVEIAMGLGPQGNFDAAHLKAIHQHLFQDVFEWAGHSRDERVRLSDGSIVSEPLMFKPEGKPFAPGAQIRNGLDEVGSSLREANYLRELDRTTFAARAADVMADLNSVHPFREGNGRTQRAFITALAQQAGHSLDFSVVSGERMAQASIEAHERGDNTMMRRMFEEISDPSRVAALSRAIEFFEQQQFPWNDRYLATTEPGQSVYLVMSGVAGEHFMARTATEILIGQAHDLPEPVPVRGQSFTLEPTGWPTHDDDRERGSIRDADSGAAMTRGAIMVFDEVTDLMCSLVEFVADLFAGGGSEPPKPNRYTHLEQLEARERAAQAVVNLQERMERGDALRAEDVRNLTPEHLKSLSMHGDDAMRALVQRENDGRTQEQSYGWER